MTSRRAPEWYRRSASHGPLHPLSFELADRHPEPRQAILNGWNRILGGARFPIPKSWIGETPLIASQDLIARLDQRVSDLVRWLKPLLAKREDPVWPLAPAADVLSADLAIVRAPKTETGWDLRWVELQTFTSLVSMIYTLHLAAAALWPELEALRFSGARADGSPWVEATRKWMAPEPGSILLENSPWSQPTRHDFEAAQRWFDVIVTEPQSLRAQSGILERHDEDGYWQPVPHIANRLILHEVPHRLEVEHLLSRVTTGWNSHPAWFYRIDKGAMPELPFPPQERCARGSRWRELDLPAESLVAKACHSYAGKSVRLNLSAEELDALESPESWVVQPRFEAAPLIRARDGTELCGEIRCVIALPKDGREEPWTVCRLARMTRGPMASSGTWTELPGEGAVPVYAPPA